MKRCACGCGERQTNPDPRRRYIRGHYEASPQGRATQAKGGRNGRGAQKAHPKRQEATS